MNINLLKILYRSNKKLFIVAVLVIAAIFLVSCSSSGGSAPSGPIGGGCG